MSSQYDRMGDNNNKRTANETTSILKDTDFSQNSGSLHTKMNKISDRPILNQSMDDLDDSIDGSDRLTEASSNSFYSQSFQLKRQMWLKNRNLLVVIAIIIISIIIFIAILISEPWKS